jgi:hypothetical protein
MSSIFRYFYTTCINCFNIFLNNNDPIIVNNKFQPLLNDNKLRSRGYKNCGNVIDTSVNNPFVNNDSDIIENDDWVIEFYNVLQNPP